MPSWTGCPLQVGDNIRVAVCAAVAGTVAAFMAARRFRVESGAEFAVCLVALCAALFFLLPGFCGRVREKFEETVSGIVKEEILSKFDDLIGTYYPAPEGDEPRDFVEVAIDAKRYPKMSADELVALQREYKLISMFFCKLQYISRPQPDPPKGFVDRYSTLLTGLGAPLGTYDPQSQPQPDTSVQQTDSVP